LFSALAVTFGLFIKEYVLSVTKPNMMSQIPRDIGPKCTVQPKEVKTKANTDRSRKRKVRWKKVRKSRKRKVRKVFQPLRIYLQCHTTFKVAKT